MTFDRMTRRIACGVAGIGIASVCAVGGVANAAPAAPAHPNAPHSAPTVSPNATVAGTKCSVAQVERALAKQDPALWKKIQSNPKVKRHFETGLTLTEQQKKAKRAQFEKKHPEASTAKRFLKDHGLTQPEMKKAHAAVEKAKTTCGQY